jgi:hypothetical protein
MASLQAFYELMTSSIPKDLTDVKLVEANNSINGKDNLSELANNRQYERSRKQADVGGQVPSIFLQAQRTTSGDSLLSANLNKGNYL